MMANRTTGAQSRVPVTELHPISTGAAPAAPPITMLRVEVRFSQRVYTKT